MYLTFFCYSSYILWFCISPKLKFHIFECLYISKTRIDSIFSLLNLNFNSFLKKNQSLNLISFPSLLKPERNDRNLEILIETSNIPILLKFSILSLLKLIGWRSLTTYSYAISCFWSLQVQHIVKHAELVASYVDVKLISKM